jgi:hypothetical protein
MGTRTLTLALLLAILAVVSGCGGKDANRSTIGGGVTLDGKPIALGSILFIPVDGTEGAATGGPIENGRYRITGKDGAAVGWNRVEVRAVYKTGRMIPKGLGGTGEMIEEQTEGVATRFNSESTLKVEVKTGDNKADFEVNSK